MVSVFYLFSYDCYIDKTSKNEYTFIAMIDEDIKNKLLILFILDKYETPINQELLTQMCCVENNWVPYFCFAHFIDELVGARFIFTKPDPHNKNDSLLTISEDGKVCLSYFYSSIFKSVRDDVAEYIRNNKLEYRKKQEFVCTYEQNGDGTYSVNCMVLNGEMTMFELKFTVPTKAKANTVAAKWQETAPEVYRTYVEMLID